MLIARGAMASFFMQERVKTICHRARLQTGALIWILKSSHSIARLSTQCKRRNKMILILHRDGGGLFIYRALFCFRNRLNLNIFPLQLTCVLVLFKMSKTKIVSRIYVGLRTLFISFYTGSVIFIFFTNYQWNFFNQFVNNEIILWSLSNFSFVVKVQLTGGGKQKQKNKQTKKCNFLKLYVQVYRNSSGEYNVSKCFYFVAWLCFSHPEPPERLKCHNWRIDLLTASIRCIDPWWSIYLRHKTGSVCMHV